MTLILNNVLDVPSIQRNLISVSQIMDARYNIFFANNCAIIKHDKHFIISTLRIDDLFVLNVSQNML